MSAFFYSDFIFLVFFRVKFSFDFFDFDSPLTCTCQDAVQRCVGVHVTVQPSDVTRGRCRLACSRSPFTNFKLINQIDIQGCRELSISKINSISVFKNENGSKISISRFWISISVSKNVNGSKVSISRFWNFEFGFENQNGSKDSTRNFRILAFPIGNAKIFFKITIFSNNNEYFKQNYNFLIRMLWIWIQNLEI